MSRVALHRFSRRAALFLIIAFQLTHFILQTLDRWGPPRKHSAKLLTVAKLNELVWTSVTCYKITEWNVGVKLGRWTIRDDGIVALLYVVAAWSAHVVRVDVTDCPDNLWGLAQLMVLDVFMWTETLSSKVGLVEKKEDSVLPIDEKRPLDEKQQIRVEMEDAELKETVNEKEEV